MTVDERKDLITWWDELGRKCAHSKKLYSVMQGRVSLLPAPLRNAFLKAFNEEKKGGSK